jgi:Spy/CpxP family protein refolding chaperone
MNRFATALTAASFALAATFAHAQAPSGDAGKGPGMMGPGGEHHMMKSCAQEADPAKCEANRKQMRENMKAAREACKGSPDKRGCMTQQFCSKQADPAKCQERAKQMHERMSRRMDEHQQAAEACTGKRGGDLMKCLHEQHAKNEHKPDSK